MNLSKAEIEQKQIISNYYYLTNPIHLYFLNHSEKRKQLSCIGYGNFNNSNIPWAVQLWENLNSSIDSKPPRGDFPDSRFLN